MSDRSNFQEMLRKATTGWAKKILDTAKKNSPRHLAPHIYTSITTTSKERFSINLGVRRIDSFESSSSIPGAVSGGSKGTLDARAQEYGSGIRAEGGGVEYAITPRKRTTSRGKPLKKYSKDRKTWLGIGMSYERGWLKVPNLGAVPEGSGVGFRPNMDSTGNFIFVKKVMHPGINKYRGRGYLRISIKENMELMKEEASLAVRKAVSATIREGLLSKRGIQVFQP